MTARRDWVDFKCGTEKSITGFLDQATGRTVAWPQTGVPTEGDGGFRIGGARRIHAGERFGHTRRCGSVDRAWVCDPGGAVGKGSWQESGSGLTQVLAPRLVEADRTRTGRGRDRQDPGGLKSPDYFLTCPFPLTRY